MGLALHRAAVATIALKSAAYLVTGSVGLLSDALESVVNLVAAVLALVALRIASRPADDTHQFGHGKVEYFSAGAEGLMILVAALLIIVSAVQRLFDPHPSEELGIGLAITLVATLINAVVGVLVLRAGRRHRSITLVADGKHLLTDVWTSVGVVVGVGLVRADRLAAARLARRHRRWPSTSCGPVSASCATRAAGSWTTHCRLPRRLPCGRVLGRIAAEYEPGEVEFHAVQTREAGRERFVSMHVLVPGDWTVHARARPARAGGGGGARRRCPTPTSTPISSRVRIRAPTRTRWRAGARPASRACRIRSSTGWPTRRWHGAAAAWLHPVTGATSTGERRTARPRGPHRAPALGSVWWPTSTNNARHLDRRLREVEAVVAKGPVVVVGHSAGAAAGAWIAAGLVDRGLRCRRWS